MSTLLRYTLTLFVVFLAYDASAQAPRLINFQAQIDGLGETATPVTFSIFPSLTGGASLWSETQSITAADGVIQVLLGSVNDLPEDIFSNDGGRYLEIVVDGEILTPRFQFTSVSYALRAEVADAISGPLVSTVNEIQGDVTIKEGANVTITRDGQELTIAAAGGGSGDTTSIQTISPGSAIDVENPNGPVVVVNVEEDGINDSHIEDNGLTAASLATDAVGSDELASNSVGSDELAPNSVGSDELAPNTAVTSLNGLQDAITMVGGSNVSITVDGQTITFDAGSVGGGGGIQNLIAGTGIAINDLDGPTSTISLANDAITDLQVADNSLTANSLAINSVGTDEIQENAVGDAELQNQLIFGPSGSLNIANAANQIVTTVTSVAGGGAVFVNQPGNNFTGAAMTIRDLDGQGAGGQLQLRGNQYWDAIHMFADGTTQGGRMLFREPDDDNPLDAVTTLAFRGENEKGQMEVLSNNDGSILIGGDLQEIKTLGRVGIGLTTTLYNSMNPLGAELYVLGNAFVSGTFTNSISRSAMDHPLDPQNMTLNHSQVISNEMITMYHGTVILGTGGEATVTLPEWFESLNTEFRYQLTCIGEWGRVYIAQKIENNEFRIAGGRQGMEVSWQITAVRNDPYAKQNPVEVEGTKPDDQRGTYMHPEAYGVTNNQ